MKNIIKHTIRHIPMNKTRDEHKEMFETEMKLLGIKFSQKLTNHNEYIITGIIDKDHLEQLNKKWYIRDNTEYYEKKRKKSNKKWEKEMKEKYNVRTHRLSMIQMFIIKDKLNTYTFSPILEFMGPRL